MSTDTNRDQNLAFAVCPICGVNTRPADRFCGKCGSPLPEIEEVKIPSKIYKLPENVQTAKELSMIAGAILALGLIWIMVSSITSKKDVTTNQLPPSKIIQARQFLVALLKPPYQKPTLQKAEDEKNACLKAGWDLSAPCVVMDLSKGLSDRGAAIDAIENLHREISLDQVGDYVILGPAAKGTNRLLSVTKHDAINSSGYPACLRAGWSPEDCRFFDLRMTGIAMEALRLLGISIGRDNETRK